MLKIYIKIIYALNAAKKLTTTCFNLASVSLLNWPSLRIVVNNSCCEDIKCFKNSASNFVILLGSNLSKWPLTPAYIMQTCSSIGNGTI